MKFTLEELKDSRGYISAGNCLRIYPMKYHLENDDSTTSTEQECVDLGNTKVTGQPLIEAIKERGGEVVGVESAPTANLPPVIYPIDYSILNDRVFVRQAAIAAMQGLLIGLPDSDCGMKGYCHDAALYANELLSAIKEHEQKGI